MTELAKREEYLEAGMHIGMRQKTVRMARFIYKTRPDGLSVLDIQKTDERIRIAATFLARYSTILVVGKKEVTHSAIRKFAELVGATAITGRFMPGMLSNPALEGYVEPDILLVVDPTADRQAILEAIKKRIPIVALCDTYTQPDFVDLIIPVNNKGKKSLALTFMLLAREILLARKKIKQREKFKPTLEDFQESK